MRPFEKIVQELAKTIQQNANAKAVFGEPVQLEERTLLPVAKVSVMLGGGAAGMGNEEAPAQPAGEAASGGGGGMRLTAAPVGFIHERNGEVVFTPIEIQEESFLSDLTSLMGSPILGKVFSMFTGVEVDTSPLKKAKRSILRRGSGD